MKEQPDVIREAISLFQQLQQERSEHQARIDAIDEALTQIRGVAPGLPVAPAATTASRRGRGSNAMPLREALTTVLAQGPQTKEELLVGVQKVGYRFATKEPMNSLQTFLYGTGKKLFTRVDGKYALAGRRASAAATKPAKVKRTMSPAARKRISEAVKARWARQKAKAAKK